MGQEYNILGLSISRNHKSRRLIRRTGQNELKDSLGGAPLRVVGNQLESDREASLGASELDSVLSKCWPVVDVSGIYLKCDGIA